jgi:hypothetical protein
VGALELFQHAKLSLQTAADGSGDLGILLNIPQGQFVLAEVFGAVREAGEQSPDTAVYARLFLGAPDLFKASVDAAGCLSACIDIMKHLGHAKAAAEAKRFYDELVAAIATSATVAS